MTLPASGPISLSNVNTELGIISTTTISLNDAGVRSLAGVASGAISLANLHGKTAWTPTLSPSGQFSAGTSSFKSFDITCNGAPAGSSYNWTIAVISGGWSVAVGQGTNSVTIYAAGATSDGEPIMANITCSVTHSGVTKDVTRQWRYSRTVL